MDLIHARKLLRERKMTEKYINLDPEKPINLTRLKFEFDIVSDKSLFYGEFVLIARYNDEGNEITCRTPINSVILDMIKNIEEHLNQSKQSSQIKSPKHST